ncbi:LemA family protein [Fimbriimonas ginsengisoli]|uniref:LemA protein n=1 Tax=Fimbriimonas ginsengisoli Gsoil 348 TaxID=661478 RepID=A0A068NSQ2_FIMGI|nr:LemA family protein [Fimbriimonas ginsengisoli]AIE86387.1 LemA protein [Fimbriimonas ginsengisoli Gsoil 348]
MEAIIIGIVVFALLILMWVVGTINRLTRLKNLVRESWAQVDVQLKRRYDLIPNLVETCRAYAAHERDVFERVVNARNQALQSGGNARDENALVQSVNGMLARVEAYPELRSNANFLELQRELSNTEDRIAASRRFFNANVRDYNIAIEQFPGSLLAGGHTKAEFFEVESVSVREAPRVTI